MKKSLIALAVAGAMTAPMVAQADATLYGYLETRLTADEDSDMNIGATKVGLGVTGLVDNDIDGLETGYQMEVRFASQESTAFEGDSSDGEVETHKANAWIEGGFGRLTAGLQNNPAERGVWSVSNRVNALFIDQTDAINNGLVYISPNMGGLELSAGIGVDSGLGDDDGITGPGVDNDGDDVDMTVLGASYRAMGLGLGIGWQDVADSSNDDTTDDGAEILSLQANYKIDALALGVTYQDYDGDVNSDDHDAWLVGASYSLGKASVYGEYADIDFDDDSTTTRSLVGKGAGTSEDDSMVTVGARYALGAKAMVQLEIARFDERADLTTLEYQLNF